LLKCWAYLLLLRLYKWCRSDPLVRLNVSLRQENLDGAAPTPPKFAILLKEEV
jgi:hypothetical protein